MKNCIHILRNTIFLLLFSMVLGKISSTAQSVNQLYDNITENLEQKKYSCSIFLDLQKAFDTVDHEILILKLNRYGICGLPLQLLKSYLSNRQQFTKVNGCESDCYNIKCGVPQYLYQ